MDTMSKTAVGGIITGLFAILQFYGVVLPEGTDASLLEAIWLVGGLVVLVWGQLSRKDLKYGLIRK